MLKIGIAFLAIVILFLSIFITHRYKSQKDIYVKSPSTLSQITDTQTNSDDEGFVERVVDGDTIAVVLKDKKIEKVRIIGMNAPESVDPRRGVECYGKEASLYLKSLIDGKRVRLERDPSQQNYDKYARALRHVFVGEINVAENMIREGYAYEYTYNAAYAYQKNFKSAQKEAETNRAGLWKQGACK